MTASPSRVSVREKWGPVQWNGGMGVTTFFFNAGIAVHEVKPYMIVRMIHPDAGIIGKLGPEEKANSARGPEAQAFS